jgi:predicted XRE-type DNA-binding protein
MTPVITPSSGDVFRDLGFDVDESKELRRRSELMVAVQKQIAARTARGENQNAIAAILGVTQPRVSDLKRGKIHLFSLEMLVRLLDRLGATVELNVASSCEHSLIMASSAQFVSCDFLSAHVTAATVPTVLVKSVSEMGILNALDRLVWERVVVPRASLVFEEFQSASSASTGRLRATNTQLALAA